MATGIEKFGMSRGTIMVPSPNSCSDGRDADIRLSRLRAKFDPNDEFDGEARLSAEAYRRSMRGLRLGGVSGDSWKKQICSSSMPRSSANDTFLVRPPGPLPLPGREPDNDERNDCGGLKSPSDASRWLDDEARDDVLDQFHSCAATYNRRNFIQLVS